MAYKREQRESARSTPRVRGIFDGLGDILQKDLQSRGTPIPPAGACIHISIEAAHPDQPGRPSPLVLTELLRAPVLLNTTEVRFHFIEDRIAVPSNLNGHIICIGGPRSNVLSRAALEYEFDFEETRTVYRRIRRPYLVHSFEYRNGTNDISDFNPTGHGSIFRPVLNQHGVPHFYKGFPLNKEVFSPGRYFLYNKEHANNEGIPKDGVNVFRSISLRDTIWETSGLKSAPDDETVIFDHTLLTVMPNVFSEDPARDRLLIYHGLRSLGTLAALRLIRDDEHIRKLRELLGGMPPLGTFQMIWSVTRTDERGCLIASENRFAGFERDDAELRIDTPRSLMTALPGTGASPGFVTEVKSFEEEHVIKLQTAVARESQRSGQLSRQILRVNQIDADQILAAMALPSGPDGESRHEGIYVLGCFERTKTLYTQQARAFTLIHALRKAKRLPRYAKIGIIGGGASGIACAIAALRTNMHVVLMERTDKLMPLQEHATHRHVHPYFYDWPDISPEGDDCDLPGLKWKAGNAAEVRERIIEKYRETVRDARVAYGENALVTELLGHHVQTYFFDPNSRRHCVANWSLDDPPEDIVKVCGSPPHENEGPDEARKYRQKLLAALPALYIRRSEDTPSLHDPCVVSCDVLVIAAGFGVEASHEVANTVEPRPRNRPYWENDEAAFKKMIDESRLILVSGSGDGALIDILRLCIKNFDHADLVERIRGLSFRDRDDLGVRIREAAHKLQAALQSESYRSMEAQSIRLSYIRNALSNYRIDTILDDLHLKLNDVLIYNIDQRPQPFSSPSALIHRLLVLGLFEQGRVKFFRGCVDTVQGQLSLCRHVGHEHNTFEGDVAWVARHGVGAQRRYAAFLDEIIGLASPEAAKSIDDDGRRLVALLNLTSGLHPETYKFFRYTYRAFL